MKERSIFLAALEIQDPAARLAYLETACAGDAVLRGQVETLLQSHQQAGSFLEIPVVEQLAATPPAVTDATMAMAPASSGPEAGPDGDPDSQPLRFLQPSSQPGSLGRLAHYEVLEILGQGAFGIVLKAFDEKLHRMVAIKVMSTELASTSPARKRFLREARSAAAIRHDNVVAIHAVEEQPLPYLVMEYIPREDAAAAAERPRAARRARTRCG